MRSGSRDTPIVVKIHDEVTGALSVASVEATSAVLDEWFPHLTPRGREVVAALRDRLEAEDWRRVGELAAGLGLRIERL